MQNEDKCLTTIPFLLPTPFSPQPLPPFLTQTQKFTKFLSELLHHYIVVRKRVRSQSISVDLGDLGVSDRSTEEVRAAAADVD